MAIYNVISQNPADERTFTLRDKNNGYFEVDIFTNGESGLGDDASEQEYLEHLSSFVGKRIDIPDLMVWRYFSHGKITVLDKLTNTNTSEDAIREERALTEVNLTKESV